MLFHVNLLHLVFISSALWAILVTVEGCERMGWIHGEVARKAIHVSVGLLLASLPLFMNRREIFAINVGFLVGIVVLSGLLHIFRSIEDVPRWTIGQYLYPFGIIIVTLFFKDLIVYSFSVLVLALADGFAALIGQTYGEKSYRTLGGAKTFLGSFTFFSITLSLLLVYVFTQAGVSQLNVSIAVAGTLFLTIVEGIFGAGFDNLVLPLATALVLTSMH